jgi:membrane-bound lytic murein transglycosylase F
MGHMHDAWELTKRQGGNPDKWSEVMERLPLLQQRAFYKQTRHGYARGTEAVIYVQHIRSYYNLLDWQRLDEYRRKPPIQVAGHIPEGLRNIEPLVAL